MTVFWCLQFCHLCFIQVDVLFSYLLILKNFSLPNDLLMSISTRLNLHIICRFNLFAFLKTSPAFLLPLLCMIYTKFFSSFCFLHICVFNNSVFLVNHYRYRHFIFISNFKICLLIKCLVFNRIKYLILNLWLSYFPTWFIMFPISFLMFELNWIFMFYFISCIRFLDIPLDLFNDCSKANHILSKYNQCFNIML